MISGTRADRRIRIDDGLDHGLRCRVGAREGAARRSHKRWPSWLGTFERWPSWLGTFGATGDRSLMSFRLRGFGGSIAH
jgi:hypothetical protein